MPGPDRHPKEILHDAIQESLKSPLVTNDEMTDALLTRWVLVGELMLPNEQTGLAVISSTAGNVDMTTWDRYGFLIGALAQTMKGRTR